MAPNVPQFRGPRRQVFIDGLEFGVVSRKPAMSEVEWGSASSFRFPLPQRKSQDTSSDLQFIAPKKPKLES